MTQSIDAEWLSVHLFYSEPWEKFLIKSLKPFVDTLVQAGISENWFFIRYRERGPHIRLRIKAESELLQTIVRHNLEEHFTYYFEAVPSKRTEPRYPRNTPEDQKWLPNHSIIYDEYLPETARFAGPAGLAIAEQQFEISSTAVLQIISAKGDTWSYEDALGSAIQLHLSFVRALHFTLPESIAFFDLIFQQWLPYSFKFYHISLTKEQYSRQESDTLKAFEESFVEQKESLLDFHRAVWDLFDQDGEFEEDYFNDWVWDNRYIGSEFNKAYQAGLLLPRPDELQSTNELSDPQKKILWPVYADFVHLTNNRIGLMNQDEAYLAWLIRQCLMILASE